MIFVSIFIHSYCTFHQNNNYTHRIVLSNKETALVLHKN